MFADSIIRLVIGLELGRYIYIARGNWNNYKSDNKLVIGNEEDEKSKDIKRRLNNLFILYGICD